MYLVNFIDELSSSDIIFALLMLLLTIISVILVFLIYTQNKEMSRQLKERKSFEECSSKVDNSSMIKEVENLTSEKPKIVPITDLKIPDYLELTQSFKAVSEADELQDITKQLETLPRERKIEMTPFEAEQEEKAIISYDELIKHSDGLKTNKVVDDGSFKVDNNFEGINEKINLVSKDSNSSNEVYAHEEYFLKSLKSLLSTLIK
ncbi:MAG: hypothetical protein ACI4XM_07335 [Candidatus Coprovivens sp.]